MGAELVAQRHADNAGLATGPGSHGREPIEPLVVVKEARVGIEIAGGVGPPTVAVVEVAAPGRLGDVVVENGHDTMIPERRLYSIKRLDYGGVGKERILLHGGAVHAHQACLARIGGLGGVVEGLLDLEARVKSHIDGISQAHAVEAVRGDPIGNVVDRLLVQAFGHIGLEMARPVDAPELDALVVAVHDPAARRVKRHFGFIGGERGHRKAGKSQRGKQLHAQKWRLFWIEDG